MDWSTTLPDAAGVVPHPDYPLDRRSRPPLLGDAGQPSRRPLHWRKNRRGQRAHHDAEWTYLRVVGRDPQFNIADDERERANHATLQPE